MRTLNRPMFNMGGPIKQGIMHGIREPHFRGQIVGKAMPHIQRGALGADVGALGQLGSLRQGLSQAQLTADQQAAQPKAYEPYGRLSQYGQGITGLTGGVASAQYAQPQEQSPWSSALSPALGVGGLYQKMFMPQPMISLSQ